MIKYLGTHNSGTSSKLVWWQRPFGYLLNLTSCCQALSIDDQLKNNVRLFNLQVTYYKNEWVFSHGLCIYTGKLLDTIESMKQYATEESPVYFQLFLDKNFFLGQNKEVFKKLVDDLLNNLKDTNVRMIYAYIEGTSEYPYVNSILNNKIEEHYWTLNWGKTYGKSFLDKLPLPKRHAKIYNDTYIKENKSEYLMLDFVKYEYSLLCESEKHVDNTNKDNTNEDKVNNVTTTKIPLYIDTTVQPTPTSYTYFTTTTTSVEPIYATVVPPVFVVNDKEYKSNESIICDTNSKISLLCSTVDSSIYYTINGKNKKIYSKPFKLRKCCTIEAYATKETDYDNNIYYEQSSHSVLHINMLSSDIVNGKDLKAK